MAISADDKLAIFFLENRIWHVMQIISILPKETICMKCKF